MGRILLADDSPHAQRMGERILREEGLEVVSLTDGETVLHRMADVDPDVLLADAFLPQKSGLDLCRYVKGSPLHRHVRAGAVWWPSAAVRPRHCRQHLIDAEA